MVITSLKLSEGRIGLSRAIYWFIIFLRSDPIFILAFCRRAWLLLWITKENNSSSLGRDLSFIQRPSATDR
jgi:hypothetical protein